MLWLATKSRIDHLMKYSFPSFFLVSQLCAILFVFQKIHFFKGFKYEICICTVINMSENFHIKNLLLTFCIR